MLAGRSGGGVWSQKSVENKKDGSLVKKMCEIR